MVDRVDPPLLTVSNLQVAFGGVRAIDDLSFDMPAGSIVSLIGPNGAGKTTVLNAISGFVRARGSVRFGGRNLLRTPAHHRAALGIGRTFQNLQLFSGMTVLENLLVGQHATIGGNPVYDVLRFPVRRQEQAARDRAFVTMRELGLEPFAGSAVESLPFGVQKLVGVARALVVAPRLLLLDEPAAGLTPAEAMEFGVRIARLGRDRGWAVLLVEHNVRLVMAISDRILVLDGGQRLAEGTPAEIREHPAVVEAYLGTSAGQATPEDVLGDRA